jgi:hypothetical protein
VWFRSLAPFAVKVDVDRSRVRSNTFLRAKVTAKSEDMKLGELKRLLQRLDKTMQASPPVPRDMRGFAPLIPTGREVIVPAQPADALAGVRGQGAASTSGRTIVFAAGVSATVSLAIFALVFGGITTPQREITAKAKDEARPTAGMPTAAPLQSLPQSVPARQAAVDELKAPVPLRLEPVRAVEAAPQVQARAEMAMTVPTPAGPEPAGNVGPAPNPAPPQETAALNRANNVPPSKDTDGRALGDLDALQLLRRGLNMLSSGNVRAAQLLLERAADLGSGDAAFALATTYDGSPGSPRSGSAVRPNVDLALRWYQRAQELGVEDARKRLSELKGSSPGG